MGILFISHASQDNARALQVRDWLKAEGWGEVFLDLDPQQGLAPGQRWQEELKAAGERCAAVVALISPHWVASRWCQVEYLVAVQLGKRIFGVVITQTPFADLPLELKAHFQLADISDPAREEEGFGKLCLGLQRAGLHAEDFPWPPPKEPRRSPYRGLGALEEQDAAIFFGREASITKGLDTLRRLRDGAPERILVILGASGAGKSSFLKAGLLARLQRDETNFVVLPTLRPERAALTGPRGLLKSLDLAEAPSAEASPTILPAQLATLRAPTVLRLERLADAAGERFTHKPPTLILPIDQAEELFAAGQPEGAATLDLLHALLAADGNLIVLLTLRSDSFALLQSERRLADVARLPFDLPGLSPTAWREVIEGPGRLADPTILVDPALTEKLGKDLDQADALPLLAFTLERLARDYVREGRIGLVEYEEGLGGLQGAIEKAAAEALEAARQDRRLPQTMAGLEELTRRAFIPWLVRVDQQDAPPKRRVALLAELPTEAQALVGHLVDQRLLVQGTQSGEATVEVSHEAVLRHWPALGLFIVEERDDLRTLDTVLGAAQEWHAHSEEKESESWLTHRGHRLEAAEYLLQREDYTRRLGEEGRAYLAACRERDKTELQMEREQLEREQALQARQRVLQRRATYTLMAVALLVALFAAYTVKRSREAARQVSLVLVDAAQRAIKAGEYTRAARFSILAARESWLEPADPQATPSLASAAFRSSQVLEIPAHKGAIEGWAESPDGKLWLTWGEDGMVRVWNAADGALRQERKGIFKLRGSARFSPDGSQVLSFSEQDLVEIWQATTGALISSWRHNEEVEIATFSPDGKLVLSWNSEGIFSVREVASCKEVANWNFSGSYTVATFAPQDERVLAWGSSGACVFEGASGTKLGCSPFANDISFSAFAPGGASIESLSFERGLWAWDAKTGALRFERHYVEARELMAPGAGNQLMTRYGNGKIDLLDRQTGRLIAPLSLGGRPYDEEEAAVFSPDGRRVLLGNAKGSWILFEAESGKVLSRGSEASGFEQLTLAPNGERLLLTFGDGWARMIDLREVTEIAGLKLDGGRAWGGFSAQGERALAWGKDGNLRAFAPASRGVAPPGAATRPPASKSPASNGKLEAVWEQQGEWVQVRRVADGQEVFRYQSEALIGGASLPEDGNEVLLWDLAGAVEIWDLVSKQKVASWHHYDGVRGAVFAPDGRRVLSWDSNSLLLTDAATSLELAKWQALGIDYGNFNYEGDRVLAVDLEGRRRAWDVSWTIPRASNAELIAEVCDKKLVGPEQSWPATGADRRSVRRISEADATLAPILRGRVGEDVCRPLSWLERLLGAER